MKHFTILVVNLCLVMVVMILFYGQPVAAQIDIDEPSAPIITAPYSFDGTRASLSFSGSNAVAYAERWSSNKIKPRNSDYPTYSLDCTNFASQVLRAGGYPFRDKNPQWYAKKTCSFWGCSWNTTPSWRLANEMWNFLWYDNPGGIYGGVQNSNSNHNSAAYGDLLFYDWDNNGVMDHVSVEVVYQGMDPISKWSGDLVDQHSNDRNRAIWHLRPYNSQANTTTIWLMHIDSRN